MNSTAVKAFLRGAMQEDPTDEQIEELIEYLKGFVKVSKATRQLLLDFQDFKSEMTTHDLSHAHTLRAYFFDNDWHSDYYEDHGTDEVENINWEWICEQLKHQEENEATRTGVPDGN